jgi:hypothetical protein
MPAELDDEPSQERERVSNLETCLAVNPSRALVSRFVERDQGPQVTSFILFDREANPDACRTRFIMHLARNIAANRRFCWTASLSFVGQKVGRAHFRARLRRHRYKREARRELHQSEPAHLAPSRHIDLRPQGETLERARRKGG